MVLALNNLKRVDMPLNKENKPNLRYFHYVRNITDNYDIYNIYHQIKLLFYSKAKSLASILVV